MRYPHNNCHTQIGYHGVLLTPVTNFKRRSIPEQANHNYTIVEHIILRTKTVTNFLQSFLNTGRKNESLATEAELELNYTIALIYTFALFLAEESALLCSWLWSASSPRCAICCGVEG